MTPGPALSVIVPFYNEEDSIARMHAAIVAAVEPLGIPFEMVFVDDGSRDRTAEVATGLAHQDPRVVFVKFRRNYGQTPAMAAGIQEARGRVLITMDGDLQNDPADIPRVLELARANDIVVGWRRHRKDAFLTRYLPSVAANTLLGWVSGVRLHDNGCSLKVFRAEVVKPLRLRPGMHRYLPALAKQFGGRIVEVEVNHRPRQFGHSKYGLSRTFRVVADLIHLRRLIREAGAVTPGEPPLYEIADVRETPRRS